MRLGIVLEPPWGPDATLAEALGFDAVWVDETVSPAPLVTLAAVASSTSGVRLVAAVTAGPHPITLAEEAAVADLAAGGRLVLVLSGEDTAVLGETVELLFRSWSSRPFVHAGARWTAPAGLPEHDYAEARVRVTPPPAQLEPTVWLAGAAAADVARTSGLAPMLETGDGGHHWAVAERDHPLAAHRLRRPGRVAVKAGADGSIDTAGLQAALRREQAAWGMDVAILELPTGLGRPARERALHAIATIVRPTLQLDRLPSGLEQHWKEQRSDA